MNCYKALKINSFSGSVGIDSEGADFLIYPDQTIGETRNVSGTCNIITPFTDFTNRELKCRALLDYRVEHDPEIAEKGWLIRRHYVISGVNGLCANCGLEGLLKYQNENLLWGTTSYTNGDVVPTQFYAGTWAANNGPWFNKFQYCKRAQDWIFSFRNPPDPWIFFAGGGCGLGFTGLTFTCYDAFNGSASDFKSYDSPPAFGLPGRSGYANGTFRWDVQIE